MTDSHLAYFDEVLEPPPLLSAASRASSMDYSHEEHSPQPQRGGGGGEQASRVSALDSKVDLDRYQNRGLVLNNRTLARDIQTQARLLKVLQEDIDWHVANRQT